MSLASRSPPAAVRAAARLAALATVAALAAAAPDGWPRVRAAEPGPPPPLPPVSTPAAAVREAVLPNGLRVVVVEHHRRPVVVVHLAFPQGALGDLPGSTGASWLALQLATDFHELTDDGRRDVEERSLRRRFVDLGATLGAEVDADGSALAVTGYARDVGRYLDLLAGAVRRPRRGADSFERRRDALLDAIEDLESSDPEALERVVEETAFGAGHPYARSVIGTKSSMEALGLEDVVARQDQVLVARGATLIVVGDVRAEEVLRAAGAAFGGWGGAAPPVPRVAAALPAARPEVSFLERKPASTLLVCATRPLGDLRGGDAVLDVLAAALGGGLRSRLGEALREQAGLTYVATAGIVRRRQGRAFVACAPLDAARADAGVALFRSTLEGLRTRPIAGEELERARAIRLAALDAAREDTLGLASAWAEAVAIGRARPIPDEERRALEAVTAADVRRAADALLRPGALRWIASGERATAQRAARVNGLGPLRELALDR